MQLLVLSALLAVAAASGVKTGYGYAGKRRDSAAVFRTLISQTIVSGLFD